MGRTVRIRDVAGRPACRRAPSRARCPARRPSTCARATTGARAASAPAERGLRVPEDVSVVGYDDLPPATAAGLTTVRSHQDALGAATAGALVGLIAGDESPRRVRVPVARATTSPAA